jgi:hypothetical protein
MTFDWEFFVRIAFGFKSHNGRLICRGGDPAGLATNDILSERSLNDVKAVTAYAMEIFNGDIRNRETAVPDGILVTMESYVIQALRATGIREMEDIVESYKTAVFNEYFRYDGMVLGRKKGKVEK